MLWRGVGLLLHLVRRVTVRTGDTDSEHLVPRVKVRTCEQKANIDRIGQHPYNMPMHARGRQAEAAIING